MSWQRDLSPLVLAIHITLYTGVNSNQSVPANLNKVAVIKAVNIRPQANSI